MDGDPFAAAAALLGERSRRLAYVPRFEALQPEPPQGRVVAVDGSHAVLVDNGAVWVVATRAAAVPWPAPGWVAPAPQIHAATPMDAAATVAPLYEALGLEAPRVGSAEAFAEAIRDAGELRAALQACHEMSSNDLLLIDGALERLAPSAQPAADRLLEAAEAPDSPAVVAVAKRSGLEHDGVPLISALQATGPAGTWTTRARGYEMACVARLHAMSRFAFRIDATRPERLGEVADLSRDAVYLGYPYPLARAHNHVVISKGHARSLRVHLADAVRIHAGPVAYRLLEDFHATLDANTP